MHDVEVAIEMLQTKVDVVNFAPVGKTRVLACYANSSASDLGNEGIAEYRLTCS